MKLGFRERGGKSFRTFQDGSGKRGTRVVELGRRELKLHSFWGRNWGKIDLW